MKNFILNLFGCAPEPIPKEHGIKAGQIRVFRGGDVNNPFSRPPHRCKVKEVKDGWVRYGILPSPGVFNNESKDIASFLHCYPTEV